MQLKFNQSEKREDTQAVHHPLMIMPSQKLHEQDRKLTFHNFAISFLTHLPNGTFTVHFFTRKMYKLERSYCLCFIFSFYIKISFHASQLLFSDVHGHFRQTSDLKTTKRTGRRPTDVSESRMIEHCADVRSPALV